MLNLYLKKINKIDPKKNAVIFNDEKLNYADLTSKINYMYSVISSSFGEKKVVAILGDYSFNSIALIFALSKHKCVFVPIISGNKTEVEKKIEICSPDYIIDSKSLDIHHRKNQKNFSNNYYSYLFNLGKSGLVLFSSGSTGVPKAMVHNFDNLLSSYLDVKTKDFTFLVFLMFDHIGGLNTMLNVLSMGSTMIIPDKREPETIGRLMQEYNVNILPASPTFLNLMNIGGVFDSYNFSSLKLVTYGTEPMSERLLTSLKLKLPKTKFIQTFGTSETGIIKTQSESSKSLLIKFEDDDQDIKIIDGELWIKSKTRVLGYLNHSNDAFTDDGWFKTGDLIEKKDDGYFKIIGRKSKIINVGGEKVLPIEIEKTILDLSYVLDCTVYAKDNLITGQVVAVKVVVGSIDKDIKILKKEIKLHCKNKLERYKVPAEIIITNKITYTSRFKKN
jgi:acyl-coenzyme A synthetase/AMP-(fatty) acid ligase